MMLCEHGGADATAAASFTIAEQINLAGLCPVVRK
jgi:hypothetical protein